MLSNKIIPPSRVLLQQGNIILTRSQLAKFSSEGLKVNHDLKKQQFYVEMDRRKAIVDYEKRGNRIIFIHTEVPTIFQGKGVGKILAKEAFSYSMSNKLAVQLECDFLRAYYEGNKEQYKDMKIHIPNY